MCDAEAGAQIRDEYPQQPERQRRRDPQPSLLASLLTQGCARQTDAVQEQQFIAFGTGSAREPVPPSAAARRA